MSGRSTKRHNPNAAPANGRLTGDANFMLNLGLSGAQAVSVLQANTNDNNNRSDLVADIDFSLAAAGLSTSVVAALDANNRLTLSTIVSSARALELRASDYSPTGPPSSDPTVTELGFRELQFAFDSLANHVFLEDAAISASLALAASDIDATAELGFLSVGVVDGTGLVVADFDFGVRFELSFGIDMTDPDNIVPVLYESTNLALGAELNVQDINMSANIGPLGVFLVNGTFLIDVGP